MLEFKLNYEITDLNRKAMYPPKLDTENDNQYFLFTQYLDLGLTRNMTIFQEYIQRPIRTLYAYAKKFDWYERAKEYDRKDIDNYNNQQDLIKQKSNLIKKDILNRMQARANDQINNYLVEYPGSTGIIDDPLYTSKLDDIEHYETKLRSNIKALMLLETYLRICTKIDKQYQALDYENIIYNKLDQKVLELDGYLDPQLQAIDNYIKQKPNENIFEELDNLETQIDKLEEIA